MKKLYLLCGLFVSNLSLISFAQKQEPEMDSKPNIVYILADDQGFSDMNFQNSSIHTPNLDKLREDGMYLKRNYVQPQCSPTRVGFLTGRYPYRYGLHEHIVLSYSLTGIPGEEKTIAEKMKEGGYKTAIIGKWHVGGHKESYLPHNQGFDYSFICINGAINYWNYTHANNSDIIENGKKYYAPSMKGSEASGNKYSTYLWRDKAMDVITSHDKKQPLFMYLAFNAPHLPMQAPEKKIDKYEDVKIDDYWADPKTKKRSMQIQKLIPPAIVSCQWLRSFNGLSQTAQMTRRQHMPAPKNAGNQKKVSIKTWFSTASVVSMSVLSIPAFCSLSTRAYSMPKTP